MKISLTDVLTGGLPGSTMVHVSSPWSHETMLCGQYGDGRVASYAVAADVDCMTCLVRDGRSSLEQVFYVWQNYDDGADDR